MFFRSGRLGNQLFQYTALRSQFPREKIYLFGLSALHNMFDGVDAKHLFLKRSWAADNFTLILQKLLNVIGKHLGLISTYREQRSKTGSSLAKKPGLFSGIKYCTESYFFDVQMISDEVVSQIRLKPHLLSAASDAIADMAAPDKTKIFVHVRRGDYVHWPTRAQPAVLPATWYNEAMVYMREKYRAPLFILFSDDTPYVEETFGTIDDVYISRNCEQIDFTIMSQCAGGILSASSFAWWAARLAVQENPDGIFVAPEYWIGHRSKGWYPPGFTASWLTYLPVSHDKM